MYTKPPYCYDCPIYADGKGFVPDHIVPGSKIAAVYMYPSTYEIRTGEIGSGFVAEQYTREHEQYSGPVKVSKMHVIRCRGQQGVKLPTGKIQAEAVKYCRGLDDIPAHVDRLVYVGKDVMRHLRPDVKGEWRGHLIPKKEDSHGENT
jgi:hypothetical protein